MLYFLEILNKNDLPFIKKKKKVKLHFTPNYLPIFTFTSKISNVTLNPP
jgi:hypothetical protein